MEITKAVENFTKSWQHRMVEGGNTATLHIEPKRKYIKIVSYQNKNDKIKKTMAFVDKENGNVYKPASANAPHKTHIRSNVFDDDNGMSGVTPWGVVYL